MSNQPRSYRPRHSASRPPDVVCPTPPVVVPAFTETGPPPTPRARVTMFAVRLVTFGLGAAACYLLITGGNLGGLDPRATAPGQAAREVSHTATSPSPTTPTTTPTVGVPPTTTPTPGTGEATGAAGRGQPTATRQPRTTTRATVTPRNGGRQTVVFPPGETVIIEPVDQRQTPLCSPWNAFCLFRR